MAMPTICPERALNARLPSYDMSALSIKRQNNSIAQSRKVRANEHSTTTAMTWLPKAQASEATPITGSAILKANC